MSTIPSYPQIITGPRYVRNQQPQVQPGPQRIALIGEAPGEDEENYGFPFVGRSGQFLDRILSDVGINRRTCFVGNICQVRPPGNDIGRLDWNCGYIQEGLATLRVDLQQFSPNICVLLGGAALRAAHGDGKKISDWRGTLFLSDRLVVNPTKCIATLHPAAVLREYSGFPLLKFDLKRAAGESYSPDLVLPQRDLITNAEPGLLCHIMDSWPDGQRCSLVI